VLSRTFDALRWRSEAVLGMNTSRSRKRDWVQIRSGCQPGIHKVQSGAHQARPPPPSAYIWDSCAVTSKIAKAPCYAQRDGAYLGQMKLRRRMMGTPNVSGHSERPDWKVVFSACQSTPVEVGVSKAPQLKLLAGV
jgi:hypothetical protein